MTFRLDPRPRGISPPNHAFSLDYFTSDVCSCAYERRKACGLLRMTVGLRPARDLPPLPPPVTTTASLTASSVAATPTASLTASSVAATPTASLTASPAAATPTFVTSAGKHVAHSPPTLLADSSFQVFRQWRRPWEDYSTMLDSQRLPRHKQLQLMMAVVTGQVLDTLQSHFKSQRNEALRRRELLCCKQADGESFSDFFVRLKNLAEEVDLCTGNAMTCAEIQLKMVLLMGVRDEELIQRLISLDTGASLQDVVTCCRSFEATRHTASAIYSSPSQLRAMSTYKKGRRHDKTPHSPQQPPSGG
ncbi:hypothetical protein GWK47_040884 [Chionoecetes opilio]|uniref:Retrotransposon gag domain-containing protein n=1 Tax=Chionoecetes opilio TaxID=41210 RepID=A0A8J4YCX1_CHIOP|nr:hypothetical protein GWK47_040884 [Chionoecetes opilio]